MNNISEPKIHVITGPMYSSKTRELILQIERYKYADRTFQIFMPKKDDRYSKDNIITHDKTSVMPSIPVDNLDELQSKLNKDTAVIGIDEAQFFESDLVQLCSDLRKKGKTIYVAGLDMDYCMRPFAFSDGEKNMGDLFAIADYIDKRTAVCQEQINGVRCGADAKYTRRLTNQKDLVVIGSEGQYISTCLKHHIIPE